ncbi:MAG: hypothetical protein SFY81_08015 [Verrucomicrobiota bacterium]|nr:hypothetical protein [Verrucomicrobiota bacterium]
MKFPARLFAAFLGGAMLPITGSLTRAQNDPNYLMRTPPYQVYQTPEPRDYNLKWGRVTGRLHGSLQTEFNDNINLVDERPESDLIFFPHIGIGFFWPLSEVNRLQLDLGFGYRAYLDHSELDSVQVSPDSQFNYQITVGKVRVLFRDNFHIQVDPTTQGQISGTEGNIINFRRLYNDAGLLGEWETFRDVTFITAYDYVIDRSLSDQFQEFDRQDHTVALAALYNVTPRFAAGLNSSLTFSDYDEDFQNDGMIYSIGPQVTLRPTQFITLEGNVSYTVSDFDESGRVNDQSDYSGLNYGAGIRHIMNSRITHYLRVSKYLLPGYGSNYADVLNLQYGLSWRLNASITLNSSLAYENLIASIENGEKADRYLFYMGTGLRISQQWHAGVGYSFSWKNSNVSGRDYTQNRITLDIRHEF